MRQAANKKSLFGAVISAVILLSAGAPAWADYCSGQPASGLVCANSNAGQSAPGWTTVTLLFDRSFGATQGTILNRGASSWSETATPSLGLNGATGGSITLNGSTSGSSTIGVKAAAGTSVFNLPVGNGTSGFVLTTDGSGNTSWTNNAAGGTVQSVALALPSSILTVSGSPVTTTGTLTGTLATQSANTVWSGPASGSAATPTFRSLVGADLPDPSASSLGGVQSFAGSASHWINTISTSGVPSSTQPAFSDLSGTLSPTQCPNPSASTIGCVQSFVAVAHQWINSISTSGVPISTQPAFSDISGNASLAQLPGIGSNAIISNITGGTATPLGNSLTTIIDASIGSTQGDVLYRGPSGWNALAPGTSGQVLTTGGTAANPSWTSVGGTGTVTSVATNNGITGGTITTSGTIGLAPISTGNVLANVTGSTGVPTATIPSAVLDVIGSTEGSVLYRGASTWLALAPGTNGQFLQTQGAGSTPQWSNAGNVTGPGSSTAGHLSTYSGTSGTVIQDQATIATSQAISIGSGQPWADVTFFGAVGNSNPSSAAANSTAFTNAQNAVSALNGGTVFVPPATGLYCLSSTVTLSSKVWVQGAASAGASQISACGNDITVFNLSGSLSGLNHLEILGKGLSVPGDTTFGASFPTVECSSSAVQANLMNLTVQGGSINIRMDCIDAFVQDIHASQFYGNAMMYFTAGNWLFRLQLDNRWPNGLPSPGTASPSVWQASHAYTSGTVVTLTCPNGTNGAMYIQAMSSGTSGSSAPNCANLGTTFSDGTTSWQVATPVGSSCLQADGGTAPAEIQISQLDMGSCESGFSVTNAAMAHIRVSQCIVSGNVKNGFNLVAGNDISIADCEITGGWVSAGVGVNIGPGWGGKARVHDSLIWSGQYDIFLGTGATASLDNSFIGNHLFGAATAAIGVVANTTQFLIANNIMANDNTYGSNAAAVIVASGSSDFYNITNNIVGGNAVTDGGSGTHKTITGNN